MNTFVFLFTLAFVTAKYLLCLCLQVLCTLVHFTYSTFCISCIFDSHYHFDLITRQPWLEVK